MFIVTVVIGLLLSSASGQTRACDDLSGFKQLMKGPPGSLYEYRGRYVNRAYDYSVRIPKGLIAYDGRDVPRHNGFVLALGKESPSVIFVTGDPNSAEYKTPREEATELVKFFRQQGKIIESETITESHLGTLSAVRLLLIYTCPGSADRHVLSCIVALSADKGSIYDLEMYSPADRYERDGKVLDQIRKSWKTISRSRRRRHREH